MKDIFNSPFLNIARSMVTEVSEQFAKVAPEFANWLENNIEEGLTCFQFPKSHPRRNRTSNGVERINREIKRRSRVAVLLPSAESALRLASAVLMEIHEEWASGKVYLDMSEEKSGELKKIPQLAV
jgi:transposase-like protein